MKGFTHFVAGLAVTSFFPWSVTAASQGRPFYFLLGGTLALLPDTLDFRVIRYFYRHDIEITPDPLEPDMQMIANALAEAIDAVDRKPLRLRLNTIRTTSDSWLKYSVSINPATQHVTTSLLGTVDTGGNPVNELGQRSEKRASATFHRSVTTEYLAAFTVEMLDGPHLELVPRQNGEILIRFIPWHRHYTHSFCTSAFLAILAGLLFGWLAAPIALAAHASHILLDQLGYMGSDILWPLCPLRIPGFKLQHASSAFWNLAAVWSAMALLYYNLHSHTPDIAEIPPIGFILAAILLPLMLCHRWLNQDSSARL